MPMFRVLPSWYDDDVLKSSGDVYIDKHAFGAAEEYVRMNHANLDYPREVCIKVLEHDCNIDEAVIRLFIVRQLPAFEATEVTHDQSGSQS